MSARAVAGSVDEYIAIAIPDARLMLEELRAILKAAVPEATERISWGMPTLDLNGKHLLFFAGYEHHVGFYPLPGAIEAFEQELKPYKTAKGSVQFPLDLPLPVDLVRRLAEFRVQEVYAKPGK
jgi:uncharacterized protein YdhG (YjbR/CyaY superfamily)